MTSFSESLLTWFDIHGRKNLPWQHPIDPYRIWISEIMLQQTQVVTVIPYFNKFMEHFPNISALANASLDEVLSLWSGLGYYRRAKFLHQTAQIIHQEYKQFPSDETALMNLPGIGKTTAHAILSMAFFQQMPILDGNVKRILSRILMLNHQNDKVYWEHANQLMKTDRPRDYTQAIMDLGATCCTRSKPNCDHCPITHLCESYQHDVIASYPPKKVKKIIPKIDRYFFILSHRKKIYLEQQPDQGIWSNLWSLPFKDREENLDDMIITTFNLKQTTYQEGIKLTHKFTHFHLNIQTILIDVTETLPELNGTWYVKEEALRLGLPKPVRTIIETSLIS